MLLTKSFTEELVINKEDFPAGICFYRITGMGEKPLTGKFTVIR